MTPYSTCLRLSGLIMSSSYKQNKQYFNSSENKSKYIWNLLFKIFIKYISTVASLGGWWGQGVDCPRWHHL